MRRRILLVAFILAACAGSGGAGQLRSAPQIRVDQLGYSRYESKVAYLLAPSPLPGAQFRVVDGGGRTVLSGRAGHARARWNARYGFVAPLDLTRLHTLGTYRVRAGGAVSPPFRVGLRAALFRPRVADAVAFFQAQRDGAYVIAGPLHRRPSHLNDRRAVLYDWPRYESPDSDVILGKSLVPLGGTADLEGGWVDAGDFIKFTHTTAYAETLLLAAARTLGPNAPASLRAETGFGLRWLSKVWDPAHGVMYLQVGIGSGNKAGTFYGDHDLWRLPQRDDALAGARNRYLRVRPAFRANAPGQGVPPNLAGRVAAAFAIAAQLDRSPAELSTAAAIYAAAKTTGVRPSDVVTALPHAFYPESSWHDDMELGAAELALAAQALHDPRADGWLRDGMQWAHAYLGDKERDTLNLYDTSALAHADLTRALRAAGKPGEAPLLADLRAQLERGRARARRDPFQAGVPYDNFDAAPHAFGLVATERLYHGLTGDGRYAAFATAQRDWTLGANAWGASLMIGVGTSFPRCPQHVVANLSGRLDGKPPLLRGAVVNGPNSAGQFSGGLGGFVDGMRRCSISTYGPFTGRGSRYVDDVRAWQTVEPAIDFTAAAALAFALSS